MIGRDAAFFGRCIKGSRARYVRYLVVDSAPCRRGCEGKPLVGAFRCADSVLSRTIREPVARFVSESSQCASADHRWIDNNGFLSVG